MGSENERHEMNTNGIRGQDENEKTQSFIGSISFYDDEKRIKDKLYEHLEDLRSRIRNRNKSLLQRWPKKLTLMILKFIFVTAQLCMFGFERADFAKYLQRNNVAMKHLLLKDWKPEYETMPYPPTTGVYALYTIEELLEHINYTVLKMDDIPKIAVGSFFISNSSNIDKPIEICMKYFNKGIFYMDGRIELDATVTSACRKVGRNSPPGFGFDPSLEELIESNQRILVRLLQVTLGFKIDSVNVNMQQETRSLKCFRINGLITFDNNNINGQIPVTLETDIDEIPCSQGGEEDANPKEWFFACFVIALCCLCMGFSAVSFFTSIAIAMETKRFFRQRKHHLNKNGDESYRELSCHGVNEILKYKDIMIIVGDLLTISGSIIKIILNNKSLSSSSRANDVCGILLGFGCMIHWFGLLKYLAYDPDFKLLFSVMRKSAGKVFRFVLCVGMLYISFTLCGWVVLGPYHLKFASISSSLNCLMSLINGDEIYVSYAALGDERLIIWWFNILFLTLYVVVFTLITINILIAIFNSAYEAIHQNRQKDSNKNDLLQFLETDGMHTVYRENTLYANDDVTRCCCPCLKLGNE